MKYILLISLLFVFYGCTSPATDELPKISVNGKLTFNGENLFTGVETIENIEIKNVGKGDLVIKEIYLDKSVGEIDYSIKNYESSILAQGEELKFPATLKKGDWIKVRIAIVPTDYGIKETSLIIKSNDRDSLTTKVDIFADNFFPELTIEKAGVEGIENLLVKKCSDRLNENTLIDICNKGKSALTIFDLKLTGDKEAISHFEVEAINFPAKLKGTFSTYICIEKLSICHNGESGIKAKLEISHNAGDNVYIIDLEGE